MIEAIQRKKAAAVISAVSSHFALDPEAITGRERKRSLAHTHARHCARWCLRHYTDLSLVEIGAVVGGVDHSCVCSSIKRCKEHEPLIASIVTLRKLIRMRAGKFLPVTEQLPISDAELGREIRAMASLDLIASFRRACSDIAEIAEHQIRQKRATKGACS